jgi:uncharacterized protein (TIGR03086 family)
MENIVALHRRAVTGLRAVVTAVTPADLTRPTPCAGWDLRALFEHMTGQDRGFAAAVRGAAAGEDVPASAFTAARPLGPDPAAEVAATAEDVAAAFAGAAGLERPVLLAEFDARLPLHVVVGMHLVDTVVHGWDVAAALGTRAAYEAALDPDVVAAALSIAERIPDDGSREAPGAPFGRVVDVPAGADGWERTLRLLGRDPAWSAAEAPR